MGPKPSRMLLCCLVAAAAVISAAERTQTLRAMNAATAQLGVGHSRHRRMLHSGKRRLSQLTGITQPTPAQVEAFEADRADIRAEYDDCIALPGIAACADVRCSDIGFVLVAAEDGSVSCPAPDVPDATVPVNEFSYFLVYDYDNLFNSDGDHVVAGGSSFTTITDSDGVRSSNSELLGVAATTTIESRTRFATPFLGGKDDTAVTATPYDVAVSVGDDPTAPGTVELTASSGVTAEGTYGLYLPGVTSTAREVDDGGSEDNVVVTVNNLNALSGYHLGRK